MDESRSDEMRDLRRGDESDELEELDDLFSALDEDRRRPPGVGSPAPLLPPNPDWEHDFSAACAIMVRPTLESILWRLEEREFEADVVSLSSDAEGQADLLGGVSLLFAGADADGATVRGAASIESVSPHGSVRVRTFLDEPPCSLLDTEIPLHSLTEEYVLGITADLLARAFFGQDAPSHLSPESDRSWTPTDVDIDGAEDDDGEPDEDGGTPLIFDPEKELERPGALRRSTTAKLPFFEFDQKQWERDFEELTDDLPDPEA